MDSWSGPLRDSANPPARYALESDSEDELGEGIYDEGRHLRSKPQPTTYEISIGEYQPAPNGQIVVAIGAPGALLFQSARKNKKMTTPLSVNGVEIGHLAQLSNNLHLVAVSAALPNVALHHISNFLFDILKPNKISIIDTYPLPAYISSETKTRPIIRYLRTSPSSAAGTIPPQLSLFAPPNLLGTQTLSSTLLCEAQVRQLSRELKDSTILILLPTSRTPPPAPKKLLSYDLSTRTELAVLWTMETLGIVSAACGLKESDLVGTSLVEPENVYSKSRRVEGGAGDGNMYI